MIAMLLALIVSVTPLASARTFPHQVHTRLFPVCEGCHAGIATGVSAKVFPAQGECLSCHDGKRVARVAWATRTTRATNLRFSHLDHRKAAQRAGKPPTCQSCHASGGKVTHMSIGAAQPVGCMSCHAQKSETHLSAITECARCHVPLTHARAIKTNDVAKFPKPEWHQASDFLAEHGRSPAMRAGTCTVCHARETCERCHANADRLPEIKALGRDVRVAALEAGKPPKYFAPGSHASNEWSVTHGARAKSDIDTCGNCHVQSSCASCHQNGVTVRPVIAGLPDVPERVTGDISVSRISRRVHTVDIVTTHGTTAAANKAECAQCHSKQQCSACHSGSDSKAFHNPNYAERHAPDVFAASSRCQSCHNAETFCRSCHSSSGVAANDRMNAAFHNGQATWVLNHGQAARLGMEACAACHRQNDCVRCHSAAGGWGVNPHRAGFAADRIASRSSASCRMCHLSNPVKGN